MSMSKRTIVIGIMIAAVFGLALLLPLRALASQDDGAVPTANTAPSPVFINQGSTDYDDDDDGLIEVVSPSQLNAIRWDLNGDGTVDNSTNASSYTAAFPGALSGMGCPLSDHDDDVVTAPVAVCVGYELDADLNLDVAPYNAGEGWQPIGNAATSSTVILTLKGNGHVISNLFINRPAASRAGLFGSLGWGGKVEGLGMSNVNIIGSTDVGGLVGYNSGTVSACYVTGAVSSGNNVGGLVGNNRSRITASYSTASVVGNANNVGGLVGNNGGLITASYAAGVVKGAGSNVGGLAGIAPVVSAINSYWDTGVTGQSGSAAGTGKTTRELQSPTGYAGIYAGWNVDVDGVAGADDPWHFLGGHFPFLKYGGHRVNGVGGQYNTGIGTHYGNAPVVGEHINSHLAGAIRPLRKGGWKWERSDDGITGWTDVTANRGPGSYLYSPNDGDVGKRFRASIGIRVDGVIRTVTTGVTAAVVSSRGTTPVATGSFASGHTTPQAGQSIVLTPQANVGHWLWQWQRCYDASMTRGCRTDRHKHHRYSPSTADVGKYLRAYVYYTASDGTWSRVETPTIGPVGVVCPTDGCPVVAGSFATATTTPKVGRSIVLNPQANITPDQWRWERCDDASMTSGCTNLWSKYWRQLQYSPSTADKDKYLRAYAYDTTATSTWSRVETPVAGPVGPAAKPNVVLIFVDDLGYNDVSFNGATDITTPNIDRIATEGIIFSNGYVAQSICTASRAGLLTGRYPARIGIDGNLAYMPYDKSYGLPLDEKTIATHLRGAGYRTGIVGKWQLGAAWHFNPLNRGFDYFFGFLGGGHDYWKSDPNRPDAEYLLPVINQQRSSVGITGGSYPMDGTEYLTDVLTDHAVDYIKKDSDDPFFLYLAYNAPHGPLQAPAELVQKYSHITNPDCGTDESCHQSRRNYLAMVDSVDQNVGRVLDALIESGQRDNTMVYFLSDNGGIGKSKTRSASHADNGRLHGGKGHLSEGGIRVPFAASWPLAWPQGEIYDPMVISLDISATAMAAASAAVGASDKPLNGVNLDPYLRGASTGVPHSSLYWRYDGSRRYAIRSSDMKLVKNNDDEIALYNLRKDPSETKNLLAEDRATAAALASSWNAWNRNNVGSITIGLRPYGEAVDEFFADFEAWRNVAAARRHPLMIVLP